MFRQFILFLSIIMGCCYLVNGSFAGVDGLDEEREAQIQNILEANPRLAVYGSFGSKMYFNTSDQMVQSEAKRYCLENSMELVSVRSTEELNYLESRNVPRRYMWTSGTPFLPIPWRWGDETEPAVHPIGQYNPFCVFLSWGSPRLYMDRCDQANYFLCEHAP